ASPAASEPLSDRPRPHTGWFPRETASPRGQPSETNKDCVLLPFSLPRCCIRHRAAPRSYPRSSPQGALPEMDNSLPCLSNLFFSSLRQKSETRASAFCRFCGRSEVLHNSASISLFSDNNG